MYVLCIYMYFFVVITYFFFSLSLSRLTWHTHCMSHALSRISELLPTSLFSSDTRFPPPHTSHTFPTNIGDLRDTSEVTLRFFEDCRSSLNCV